MAISVSSVLCVVHCIGLILPKQFRTPCQLNKEENDPNLVVLFERAGRYSLRQWIVCKTSAKLTGWVSF